MIWCDKCGGYCDLKEILGDGYYEPMEYFYVCSECGHSFYTD